jgi:hypothetical protein
VVHAATASTVRFEADVIERERAVGDGDGSDGGGDDPWAYEAALASCRAVLPALVTDPWRHRVTLGASYELAVRATTPHDPLRDVMRAGCASDHCG